MIESAVYFRMTRAPIAIINKFVGVVRSPSSSNLVGLVAKCAWNQMGVIAIHSDTQRTFLAFPSVQALGEATCTPPGNFGPMDGSSDLTLSV
jgi:hypothetical protein